MGKLLTIAEAAKMLSLSRRSMERILHAGELPRMKIGRKVLIDEREIIKFAKRMTA
jgi:excisionase family DNA binding protein